MGTPAEASDLSLTSSGAPPNTQPTDEARSPSRPRHAPTGSGGRTAEAMAAQGNNISGTVNGDGSWTTGSVTRHKTTRGDIYLDLTDNVDGGLCVRLVSLRNGSTFGGNCWNAGEYGVKTLATDVLADTVFRVDARKRVAGGSNNQWGGGPPPSRIYY